MILEHQVAQAWQRRIRLIEFALFGLPLLIVEIDRKGFDAVEFAGDFFVVADDVEVVPIVLLHVDAVGPDLVITALRFGIAHTVITGTLQITRMFERKSCIIKCSVT